MDLAERFLTESERALKARPAQDWTDQQKRDFRHEKLARAAAFAEAAEIVALRHSVSEEPHSHAPHSPDGGLEYAKIYGCYPDGCPYDGVSEETIAYARRYGVELTEKPFVQQNGPVANKETTSDIFRDTHTMEMEIERRDLLEGGAN